AVRYQERLGRVVLVRLVGERVLVGARRAAEPGALHAPTATGALHRERGGRSSRPARGRITRRDPTEPGVLHRHPEASALRPTCGRCEGLTTIAGGKQTLRKKEGGP